MSGRGIATLGAFVILLCAGSVYWYQEMRQTQKIAQESTPKKETAAAPVPDTNVKISSPIPDEKKLADTLKYIGIKKAMEDLVEESSGGSAFDCHQQAHTIGRVGYSIFKEKAFAACDASCHSGCYHGAMEWFLNEKGTTNLAKNIDGVCSLFETSFENFECLHGVGHGVLAYDDYDVPEALRECGTLSDGFKQSSCYGGVFMENILTGQGLGAGTKIHETKWVNKTDPLFPCSGVDQNYDIQYQCYQMQTSWMLTLAGYDFSVVAKQCLSAPVNMISVCFKSLGRDIAGHTLRNPERIKELCNTVPRTGDYYDQCVIGAVNVVIDFWGPGLKDQATKLCTILSEPAKKTCYTIVAGRLQGIFTRATDRARVCARFESDYQYLCSG